MPVSDPDAVAHEQSVPLGIGLVELVAGPRRFAAELAKMPFGSTGGRSRASKADDASPLGCTPSAPADNATSNAPGDAGRLDSTSVIMPQDRAKRRPSAAAEFGDYVRTQRQLAKLTLRQLAGMAQVSNPYLSQIERGLHRPSIAVVTSLAKALNIPVDGLLSHAAGVDNPTSPAPAPTTEAAIRADSRLSSEQKAALLSVYRSMVGTSAADAAPPAKPSASNRPAKKVAAQKRQAKKVSAAKRPAKATGPRSRGRT